MEAKQENGLTEKEDLFCRFYIRHWNGAKAAREAGYSENSAREIASQNLTKTHIQENIKELQKDIAKLAGISRLSIVESLLSIQQSAEMEKDQIKALEVVNKMLGFNEPEKIDHTSKGEKITTKEMTTEELILRAEAVNKIESSN